MKRAWALVLSDRGRWWKAALALAVAAVLSLRFQSDPNTQSETFLTLSRLPPQKGPPATRVGPEHLLVRAVEPDRVRVEKFGVAMDLLLPAGEAGEKLRAEAASLRPGDYASAKAYPLGDARFEAIDLRRNPHRRFKFFVSGVAALFIAALLPVYFRWSKGALRAR